MNFYLAIPIAYTDIYFPLILVHSDANEIVLGQYIAIVNPISATAIVRNSVKSKPLPIPPTKIEILLNSEFLCRFTCHR